MHRAASFHHNGLLQVRFERAVGGSLGKGAAVPEGCGFATMCAFCHEITSFLAIIPTELQYQLLFESTAFYHVTYLRARC